MASSIKGMTIDIGGDTSKLQAALKQLNKPIQSIQKELSGLNRSLKLDPGNTTLLTNKQKLLEKQISETQNKITTLKKGISDLNEIQSKNGSLTEEQEEQYRKLTSELAQAEISLRSLKKEYSDFGSVASQKMIDLGNKMQTVGDAIQGVGKKLSIASGAVGGLLINGVKYTADLQKIQAGLKVATGSAEEAEKVMAQIKQDAKTTPFDVKGLAQANQLLLSTGMEADETRNLIMSLGDAVAATGGGNDELQRMAYNLQQVKNLGKASSVDIKQFGMAGIDIYGILADYLGVTKEEAAQTEVTFEQLSGALLNASQEGGKYFKGMEEQSQTLNGTTSNLKDSFNEFTAVLSKNLVPVIQNVLDKATELLNKFGELSPETQSLISNIAIIVAVAGPLLIIIGKVVSSIGMITKGVGAIMKFGPQITTAISGIKTAVGGLFAFLAANPIVLIIGAVVAVIAALVLLYNKCEWFRNGVNAVFTAVKDFVVNVFTAIGTFFTQTVPGWINFITGEVLPKLPYYIGYMVGFILGKIVQFIGNVWNFITTKVPEIIANVITFVSTLPGKLWTVFTQVLSKVREWLGNWLSTVAQKIPEIVNSIKEKFLQLPGQMLSIGRNIVEGLWNGIKNAAGWIKEKVGEFAKGILDGMKSALGINSPSKLFRDEVGRYIAEGIGVGFDKNIGNVLDNMQNKLNISMGDFDMATPDVGSRGNVTISMVINAQELNQASLEQAFNYINRRFGASI